MGPIELAKGHLPFAVGKMVLLLIVTIFYAPLVLPLMIPYVAGLSVARDSKEGGETAVHKDAWNRPRVCKPTSMEP
jgi:hypothetical protein